MINYEIIGEIYKIKSNKIIISIDCNDPTLFNSFGQPYKWVQEEYYFIKFSIDKININENQNKILKETLESLSVNNFEKYKILFEDNNNNNNNKNNKEQFKNSDIILKDLENNINNNNNNNNNNNQSDIIKIINSNNTCKVKTVTDIINHLIKLNDKNKILVYSSSNESIDFICNALSYDNNLITKIGNSSEIKNISLEYKIKHSEGGKSIKQIKQDIIELGNNTLDSKKSDINSSISKITDLKKVLNKLEKSLINKTINESTILLSSNINSLDKFLKDKNDFDWVIIDESNLILDKTCWVPILKGKKLIIISDYHN
ncbi:hypothetical protein ACTFIZ_011978 [Dictyostelium cf. discoideum]